MDNEISNKTKWCFSTSCTGRDLTYTLVSLFFITFVQFTCGFTGAQFRVLTVIIVLCRVWDAFNDPMMSTIITNTRTKYGRYKPWVLIGAISNAFFLILLFLSPGLSGWGYVAYLGVCYLLWGMTFTMNDVSYWSLIPHLTRSKESRDNVMGLVAIFASIGQFVTAGVISLAAGNMVVMYRSYAIGAAIIFVLCQLMLFITVKDDNSGVHQKNVTLKEMFKIIYKNGQLVVMIVVTLLYSLASALIVSFGPNFFYFKLGYNGIYVTIFTVIFALGTLGAQILFGFLVKKFSRAQLMNVSTLVMIIGYILFFIVANLPISLFGNNAYIYLAVLGVTGFIIFAFQGIHYLITLIMLTNTIEYGEWKTGERQEAISFSIRPFMVKFASAIEQGVLTVVLLASGLYSITTEVANLEIQKGLGEITSEELTTQAGTILGTATFWQIFTLTVGMCIIPIILFIIEYILIKKKYIIDEAMYEKMIKEIDERKEKQEGEENA